MKERSNVYLVLIWVCVWGVVFLFSGCSARPGPANDPGMAARADSDNSGWNALAKTPTRKPTKTPKKKPTSTPPPVSNLPQRIAVGGGWGDVQFCDDAQNVGLPGLGVNQKYWYGQLNLYHLCLYGVPISEGNRRYPIQIGLSHPDYRRVSETFFIVRDPNHADRLAVIQNDTWIETSQYWRDPYAAIDDNGIVILRVPLWYPTGLPEGKWKVQVSAAGRNLSLAFKHRPNRWVNIRDEQPVNPFRYRGQKVFQLGQTVLVEGAGFQPGEWVGLGMYTSLAGDGWLDLVRTIQVRADDGGRFRWRGFLDSFYHKGDYYIVLAPPPGSAPDEGINMFLSPCIEIGMSPEEFIRLYFAKINQRDYSVTWSMLSDNFKQRNNCCKPDGSFDREAYEAYWNTIDRVDVAATRTVKMNDISAVVETRITYFKRDGQVVTHTHRFNLIPVSYEYDWQFG